MVVFFDVSIQVKQLYKNNSIFFNSLFFISILQIALPLFFVLFLPRAVNFDLKSKHQLTQVNNPNDAERGEVLGYQDQSLYLSGGREYSSSGGIISLSSLDDPELTVRGYGLSGTFDVSVYKAGEQALYDYLLHDEDNKKLIKRLDPTNFQFITSFQYQIPDNVDIGKLPLPIDETGIYYLRFQQGENIEEGLVVRSGIGTVLREGENNYIFWTQNYASGKSVASGVITTFDFEGEKKELNSVPINSQGIGTLPLVAEADVAIVKSGGDFAIVPVNLQYLNTGYSYRPFQPQTIKSKYFTFTDRPLYRPGDTIFYKAILRNDDDARYTVPVGQAKVLIRSGYSGDEILSEQSVPISSVGSIDSSFTLPEDAKTGSYHITVDVGGEENGYAFFNVEYFRKPEYFLEIELEKNMALAGEKVVAKVKGEYFSGHPVSNQKVSFSVNRGNYYSYDYISQAQSFFENSFRYGYWGYKSVSSGEVSLDENGEALIEIDTSLTDEITTDQVFMVNATMDNGSGNPSIASKNILVHSSEFQVYRTDERSYSYELGKNFELPIKVVSVSEHSPSGLTLEAEVKRIFWKRQKNQTSYEYQMEEEHFSLPAVRTNNNGESLLDLSFKNPGSYTVTLKGHDTEGNAIKKDFYFYVWDKDNYFSYGQYSSGLAVLTDKKEYLPGELATFTISSETPDRDVFITFERGRVNDYQIVHVKDSQATFLREIKHTDMPNIFVAASSFSQSELDTFTENVIVSTQSKKLLVSITPQTKVVGPGQDLVVDVNTTDSQGKPVSSEVTVWAVDKAIFELASSNLPDIFKTFWTERYNNTRNTHSLMGIRSQSAEQGGGCFLANTPVLMADGSEKAIQDVKVGEYVLTRKSETDTSLVKAQVTQVHDRDVYGYVIINGKLRVTSNHKMWVNNSWKDAGSIQVDDILTLSSGDSLQVESIEWVYDYQPVYNLAVKTYNTYFAGGVWVHNQKGDGGRSVFKDTAYWNPTVRTNDSGNARIVIPLPDNLTTWVIAGVGATADTIVGQSTSEVQVTKNVVVRPLLSNIFREGDEHQVTALVQNFTNQDDVFEVSMSFDGGEIISNSEPITLDVKAGESIPVAWLLRPTIPKSAAKLTFAAKSIQDKGNSDQISLSVPVKRYGFYQSTAQTGVGDTEFKISLEPSARNDQTKISLQLASNILGTLPATAGYLIDYPYGCMEQTTSRFVPSVIAESHQDIFAEALKDKDIDAIFKKGIQRLDKHQNDDGGWGWWSGNFSDPFLSTYVLDTLMLARDVGLSFDQQIIDRGVQFMKAGKGYDANSGNLTDLDIQEKAFRNYILSLAHESDGYSQLNLEELEVDSLAFEVMSRYLRGETDAPKNGLVRLESLALKQKDGSVYWPAGSNERFGTADASTALAIRAIVLAKGNRDLAVQGSQFLMSNKKSNFWSNTFATSQVMRAIAELAKTGDELAPDYTYDVKLDESTISTKRITKPRAVIPEILIPFQDIDESNSKLNISKAGSGQLYSSLLVNQFITDRTVGEAREGLTISREYSNEKGYKDQFSVGDIVTVTLHISGLDQAQRYILVTDELPAGLVPINSRLDNEDISSPWQYRSYLWNQETTENGVILTAYRVNQGTNTFTYKARAVSAGTFTAPPAKAELMYNPSTWGRTNPITISVIDTVQPSKVTVHEPVEVIQPYSHRVNPYLRVVLVVGVVLVLLKRIISHRKKTYLQTFDSQSDQPPTTPQSEL